MYVHEFGHNLGLDHSGTRDSEYNNAWDVMGSAFLNISARSWWGSYYLVPGGLALPHKVYLGWGGLALASGGGSYWVSGGSGVGFVGGSGFEFVLDYKCVGRYESYLPFCGVVVYNVTTPGVGRWVFFVLVFNMSDSRFNFLDVGQRAWVGNWSVAVVWRNSTHARVVLGRPTLVDVVGANATFVVGAGAASIDSVAAVYARVAFSPTVTRTLAYWMESPLFAYLDAEEWMVQWRGDRALRYPGVVVFVGGPFANSLIRVLNPPDRPGVGGLPFYFDTSLGG